MENIISIGFRHVGIIHLIYDSIRQEINNNKKHNELLNKISESTKVRPNGSLIIAQMPAQ